MLLHEIVSFKDGDEEEGHYYVKVTIVTPPKNKDEDELLEKLEWALEDLGASVDSSEFDLSSVTLYFDDPAQDKSEVQKLEAKLNTIFKKIFKSSISLKWDADNE